MEFQFHILIPILWDPFKLTCFALLLICFSFFDILFHSIHATAFYLFYNRPKKQALLFLSGFIGWMISVAVSCVCSILIHLFDDSFFLFIYFFFSFCLVIRLRGMKYGAIKKSMVTSVLSTRISHKIRFNPCDKSSSSESEKPTRSDGLDRSDQCPKERRTKNTNRIIKKKFTRQLHKVEK